MFTTNLLDYGELDIPLSVFPSSCACLSDALKESFLSAEFSFSFDVDLDRICLISSHPDEDLQLIGETLFDYSVVSSIVLTEESIGSEITGSLSNQVRGTVGACLIQESSEKQAILTATHCLLPMRLLV